MAEAETATTSTFAPCAFRLVPVHAAARRRSSRRRRRCRNAACRPPTRLCRPSRAPPSAPQTASTRWPSPWSARAPACRSWARRSTGNPSSGRVRAACVVCGGGGGHTPTCPRRPPPASSASPPAARPPQARAPRGSSASPTESPSTSAPPLTAPSCVSVAVVAGLGWGGLAVGCGRGMRARDAGVGCGRGMRAWGAGWASADPRWAGQRPPPPAMLLPDAAPPCRHPCSPPPLRRQPGGLRVAVHRQAQRRV